jgi:GNAT superfamily N-acetyltransferase
MKGRWVVSATTESDAQSVAEHRYYDPKETAADKAAYVAWVVHRIAQRTYIGYTARAANLVIGGAGAVLLDWGPTRANENTIRARIVNVYTEPTWRKQGVAALLVSKVIAHCEELGVHDFCLAASTESKSLYARLGFAEYPSEMRLLASAKHA